MSSNHGGSGTESTEEHLRPRSAQLEQELNALAAVIGRKWNLVIIARLVHDGPSGFSDLLGSIEDISSKVLAESLDTLDEHGLVERTIVSKRPIRVEYSLTRRGAAFETIVQQVKRGKLRVE